MARKKGRVHTRTNQIVKGKSIKITLHSTMTVAPDKPFASNGFQFFFQRSSLVNDKPFTFVRIIAAIIKIRLRTKAKSNGFNSYCVRRLLPQPSKVV